VLVGKEEEGEGARGVRNKEGDGAHGRKYVEKDAAMIIDGRSELN
jgi:hypothetical protein